jgi:ATP-dependent RNA helicase DDX56/DBP9
MLKSPDLVEYFKENPKEKEILQQQIVKLKAGLRRSEIIIEGKSPYNL